MPKREGPEDGGLLRPPGSSSRSRPTSAGNQRGGPYSGNAAFASSSSSVNSILRPADASTAAIIQNPSAVAAALSDKQSKLMDAARQAARATKDPERKKQISLLLIFPHSCTHNCNSL